MSGSEEEEVVGGMRKFLEEELLEMCAVKHTHSHQIGLGYVAHGAATRMHLQVLLRRFSGRIL